MRERARNRANRFVINLNFVFPAKAGTHLSSNSLAEPWIPAFELVKKLLAEDSAGAGSVIL